MSTSANSKEDINQQLVQLFVEVAAGGESVELPGLGLQRIGLVAVDRRERELGSRGGREGLLDLRQRVEVMGQFGEPAVRRHAAPGEVPHALRVLVAVGVRVEVQRAGVARALEQADQEEVLLQILGAEAEV